MSNAVATTKSPENEISIYCRITHFPGLEEASKIIEQEQYEIKPKFDEKPKGKIRVRKETNSDGLVSYQQTIKLDNNNPTYDSSDELTIDIDKEFFDAFKIIASSGMIKTRHNFLFKKATITKEEETHHVNNLIGDDGAKYEVDVFKDEEGNRFSWCKIDLELDLLTKTLIDKADSDATLKIVAKISDLPFKPVDIFIGKSATEAQKRTLDYLYKNVFTIKK
jgi:hypothetical protein